MIVRSILKENWLLKKIPEGTLYKTLVLIILLFLGSNLYLRDFFNAHAWMPASSDEVFQKKEYWRLWTTLFAHADATHLFSNMVLFFPFAYFLTGFFGSIFFPFIGFFVGGLTNLIVLSTMPEHTHLIGVSGVVYWMGAAWITLAYFIDRREKKSRRFLKALGVSLILFIPESYLPEVSYFTHFVGFVMGIFSGLVLYAIKRKEFHAAEKIEWIVEEDFDSELMATDWERSGTDGHA